MVSGDNPVYIGHMKSVDSKRVSWTVVFTEAGTFNFDVNASGKYNGVTYVETHRSVTITVFEREKHDLAVWLETPTMPYVGDSYWLDATIYNVGLNNEADVELQMLINGSIANSTVIPVLLTGSSHSIGYLWTPAIEGMHNITAYAPPVPLENILIDNVKSTILSARARIPGDVDGNGEVDLNDLFYVLIGYGMTIEEAMATYGVPPGTDIDQDGLIDLDDLYEVLWNYGA